jgi:hypothetical protein
MPVFLRTESRTPPQDRAARSRLHTTADGKGHFDAPSIFTAFFAQGCGWARENRAILSIFLANKRVNLSASEVGALDALDG